MSSKYWRDYYANSQIVDTGNLQLNVGRSKNGEPIKKEHWDDFLEYLKEVLYLDHSKDLIELCCGNGQIIGEIANTCKSAYGIDYSQQLLNQLDTTYGSAVKTYCCDVLEITMPLPKFDVALIYFSIQHFNERETLNLITNTIENLLKPASTLYIGDIPDSRRKWSYICKPEHRKDYIKRVISKSPKIGNWFHPSFFEAIGVYLDITVDIIEQPVNQINSDHRFDVLFKTK